MAHIKTTNTDTNLYKIKYKEVLPKAEPLFLFIFGNYITLLCIFYFSFKSCLDYIKKIFFVIIATLSKYISTYRTFKIR
ncbi:hypothetical protein CHU_0609 [Cytophaga hutchinsonii ATCC 33406]|uniref:Uncharacterized protein n=1 Tax=Cytophaga hutchinsonii (strain ATCC 33406 / DSM 1761 / CIP 103989 / NBRC 15051 / NCIMB 9469 / D465) TaxID=269798 RepID=A0A6N4SNM4_CYTH3|nr:hypothetical protein CHU_0609 [Cytophaga hutchinsonii ATCC 33406]